MHSEISTKRIIIDTILLNASFIDNLGLMHGKMGISILFFHLARKYKKNIYEEYAGELIDEIYEEITSNTPINFENGLAGIGWGIEYIVQSDFIEADTNEVLQEFDNRIFHELIHNTPSEIGLSNGLIGLGHYFLKRIEKNEECGDENIVLNKINEAAAYIIDELERRIKNISTLIKEPVRVSEDELDDRLHPNTMNNNEDSLNVLHTPFFSLNWDYTILLWFLAEVLDKNIMIDKVEQIIYQLIEPLLNPANLPNSQLNRLLLLTVLFRLKKVFFNINKITNIENINKIISLVDIKRLQAELPQKDMSLQSGISGIILLIEQLQCLKGSNSFKEEADYCQSILGQSLKCTPDEINKLCYNDIGIFTGVSAPILISTLTN